MRATAPVTAAVALALFALPAARARAEEIRFGVSGVHHVPAAVWKGLSLAEKTSLLEQRADLAKAMGARVLRLGAFEPAIYSHAALKPEGASFRDWVLADRLVQIASSRGLELVLTLPDLTPTASVFKQLAIDIAERYDGDTDFGVPEAAKNYEFPDIDGSGQITLSDWDASGSAKKAWADAHRVRLVEVGEAPFLLEQEGVLAEGAYGALLRAASDGVQGVDGAMQVMLGGVVVDAQSQVHFEKRLAGVEAGTFDIAAALVLETTNDLSMQTASASLAKLRGWLSAVEHPEAALWLGGMSFGAAASGGPCDDPRCSERTQAASLVKLSLAALGDGYGVLAYAFPLETSGAGAAGSAGRHATTGLLTLALEPGFSPTLLPIGVRPAFATWQRLVALLDGRDSGEVKGVPALPENARGFKVGEDGWIFWYDWTKEVAPGAPYEGTRKLVQLKGLASPSVKVSPFWAASVGAQLKPDMTVEATWSEEVVAVRDGTADLFLGEDPVWVTLADDVIDPGPEAEPDAGAGGGGGSVDEGAAEPQPKDEGGCAAGGPGPLGGAWALALLVALAARVRRRGAGRVAGPPA